jgi:MFS family permease
MSEQKVWKEDGDVERESMSTGTPPGVEKRDGHLAYHTGPEPHTKETSDTPASIAPDEPPNGGYGWVCTICCAIINAHTWGLNSSYGVFLAHYLANNTFPGASYLEYAFVGSLSISCAMLVSPLATFTTRVYGTRTTLFIGIALETASLIGASFASKIWQLFLSQGICFGFGMGFLFVGSVGIVPQWFTTRRSLANGFSTCGSGLGGLIYSLATGAMLQTIGLAWAFRVLGIVACVVNTICSLLIRDRNKAVGSSQLSFDHKLFKRPEYLLLCGYGWFSILAYVVLIFSLANYANAIGLSASQAAIVSALFNLGQAFGRPPIGYFSDSIGRINMAGLMTLLSGVFALLIWVFAKSYGVLVFYALIGGTVAGTFWATVAPVTAEVVGLRGVPSALNLIWLVIVLPCTFSEPIALEIVGGTGQYIGAQLFTGFMYVAAAMCLLGLRGWKIGEVEDAGKGNAAATAGDTAVDAGGGNVVAETISLRSRKAGRKVMLSRCLRWKKV